MTTSHDIFPNDKTIIILVIEFKLLLGGENRMTQEVAKNEINTFYDNDFLNAPIFKAPNNTSMFKNEESRLLAKTKVNAEIYNTVKFSDKRDEIIESSEKSMAIYDDLALFRYNFDEVKLPKVELKEATPLSIREEGSIPVMSLIELIGAVQNVRVTRMYNKQNEDIQKRTIIWDEVKKYGLREEVSKTLFSKSVIKQFLLLQLLTSEKAHSFRCGSVK